MVSLSVFVLFADADDNALIVFVITTVTFEERSESVFEPKTFVRACKAVKLIIVIITNLNYLICMRYVMVI